MVGDAMHTKPFWKPHWQDRRCKLGTRRVRSHCDLEHFVVQHIQTRRFQVQEEYQEIVWRRNRLGAKEIQVQEADPRALTQGPCDKTTSAITEIGFRCDSATTASSGDALALRHGSVYNLLQRSTD